MERMGFGCVVAAKMNGGGDGGSVGIGGCGESHFDEGPLTVRVPWRWGLVPGLQEFPAGPLTVLTAMIALSMQRRTGGDL